MESQERNVQCLKTVTPKDLQHYMPDTCEFYDMCDQYAYLKMSEREQMQIECQTSRMVQ
jgi:hypothetical protein